MGNQATSVYKLELSNRTKNTLVYNGVFYLESLVQYTEQELREMHGLGASGVKEIMNLLEDEGYHLSGEVVDKASIADLHGSESIAIDSLGFSARTTNALLKGGVETLEQLIYTPRRELADFRGMGVACLSEIDSFLSKDHSGLVKGEDVNRKPSVTLGEFVQAQKDKDRNKQFVIEYFNGGYQTTYEVVGNKYGVTRERVRQIIFKMTKKLKGAYLSGEIKEEIVQKVRQAMDNKAEINTVAISDEYFSNAGAARLLEATFPDEIKIVKHARLNGEWFTHKNENVNLAIGTLISNLQYQPNPISVVEAKEIYGINEDMLMSIKGILEKDGYVTMSSNKKATGTDKLSIVTDYLQSINRPASINEISANTGMSVNQTRGAIWHYRNNFVNVGQSIYELVDPEYGNDISINDLAEKILTAENRPLKIEEIAKYVKLHIQVSNDAVARDVLCSNKFKHRDKYILLFDWSYDKLDPKAQSVYTISLWGAVQSVINSSDEIFDAEKVLEAIQSKFGDNVSNNLNSVRATLIKLADTGLIRRAGINVGCYMRLDGNDQAPDSDIGNEYIENMRKLKDFIQDNIGKEIEIRYKSKRKKSDKKWRRVKVYKQDTSYLFAYSPYSNTQIIRYSKKGIVDYRSIN